MSQACYAESCTNPVIGQCLQGYDGPCGRFYCHQHQGDGLCGICNDKKLHDEKIKNEEELRDIELKRTIDKYIQLSKSIKEIPLKISLFKVLILLCLSIIAPIIFILVNTPVTPEILLIAGSICLLFVILFIRVVASDTRKNKDILQKEIDTVTKDNPHFDEFYKVWEEHRNKKNKEELRSMALNTLGFSAKLAGGVVTQAHKENKKLGIDLLR